MRTGRGDDDSESIAGYREQHVDSESDQNRVGDRSGTDSRPERPGSDEDGHGDDDVRGAERDRRLLGDALRQDVPRGKPEARFEQQHDTEGEECEPEEKRGRANDDGAADERRDVHQPGRARPGCHDRSFTSTARSNAAGRPETTSSLQHLPAPRGRLAPPDAGNGTHRCHPDVDEAGERNGEGDEERTKAAHGEPIVGHAASSYLRYP